MDEVYLLWFLSISMLVGSFLSGLVPMALRLSDNKSRLLALLGSGILVGTALSIIIPEGIDALYGQSTQILPSPMHESHLILDEQISDTTNTSNNSKIDRSKSNMTWTIGSSLIVGFVLMLLIDQFSLFQGGGENHSYQSSEHNLNHSQINYTLTCQDENEIDTANEEQDNRSPDIIETASETKHIKDVDDHYVDMRLSDSMCSNNIGVKVETNPNRYYDHSKFINRKPNDAKVTPTLGLVIHAAADGIALGAAATTSHRQVEMIIFLAIMLHKAPAAFSLVVLLLHKGLKHSTIRKHLMAFSLSAPLAAMVTYFGLSQSGKEALRKNNATGIAMLFSAGTFLFVATVHVLPDLVHNKLLTPRELFFLVGGAFLPLLLAQTI